jgi:dTDP-L-rhamnose 4-epimerase
MNVLITGGAGFIGSRVAESLLELGCRVTILDNFSPQIHNSKALGTALSGRVEVIDADVRDAPAVARALRGVQSVVHFAAETGTGQSMYEISRYFDVNVQGTATLLDVLQNADCGKSLRSIIVASSRAIYGEGAYDCPTHKLVFPEPRSARRMSGGAFEPTCPFCGIDVNSRPTPESAPFRPMSIYGLTKQVQEQAVLMYARMRGINGFGLRYQNVYGPGQSLKNPYTGILAIFSNLARQNQPIEIYEDGRESRDFVYIDDVVDATVRCVNYEGSFIGALNVGSGQATTVLAVAQVVTSFFSSQSPIKLTGAFRAGDIRHNTADIGKLQETLHIQPKTAFKDGLSRFLVWAATQAPSDKLAYSRSANELARRGLMGAAIDDATVRSE